MIRSIILIVLISIVFTQCLPKNDKNSPLILSKSVNPPNGQLFGGLGNSTNSIGDIKLILTNNFADTYAYQEYEFGKEGDADATIGLILEFNVFGNSKDVEVTVAYPTTGIGQFVVTYAYVLVAQDTNNGKVEVSQGGLYQKEFGVKITAKQTSQILYYVAFAGKYAP